MKATFDFYKNEYYGDIIPEAKFDKWESRAEDELDYLTMDRINGIAMELHGDKVRKAICALAEVMYQIDVATIGGGNYTGNIASRSSGGESISYREQSTIITAVLADKTAQSKLYFDTVRKYLASTGLLFQGV